MNKKNPPFQRRTKYREMFCANVVRYYVRFALCLLCHFKSLNVWIGLSGVEFQIGIAWKIIRNATSSILFCMKLIWSWEWGKPFKRLLNFKEIGCGKIICRTFFRCEWAAAEHCRIIWINFPSDIEASGNVAINQTRPKMSLYYSVCCRFLKDAVGERPHRLDYKLEIVFHCYFH